MYLGFIFSLLIGVVLGLVGGGGSILTVPLVHYFFGESIFVATSYSLFVVAVSAGVGVLTRIGKDQVDYRGGIVFVIPSMLTAFLIRRYVMDIFPITFSLAGFELSRDVFISVILLAVMFYTAYKTLLGTPQVQGGKVGIGSVLLFGVATGLLSGFIGAGGGFIIVPILLRMGLDMKKAVGTSMFIVTIQSAVALLGDFMSKNLEGDNAIDWFRLSMITGMTVIGVLIGGYIQKYFTGKRLRQVFAFVLIGVALGMSVQFIFAG
jgi:hypothetical protein